MKTRPMASGMRQLAGMLVSSGAFHRVPSIGKLTHAAREFPRASTRSQSVISTIRIDTS